MRDIGHAIDPADKPACIINRQDRRRLPAIFGHSCADRLFIVITAPFELKTAKPLDPAVATISGREFRYAAPVPATGRVTAQFEGFGPTAADYRFTIENRKAGAGVEMIGDRPLNRLSLWSIRTVLALEPFLAFDIAPGAEYTWEYTYRYYTIP